MQAWRSGLPQFLLLLFFLQEQQPPELSPVAGDRERAPSSRYQSHLSWHLLPLLSLRLSSLTSSTPLILPLPLQEGGTVWRGTTAPGHFAAVAGA